MENISSAPAWSTGRKMVFRFSFIYFFIYSFFNFVDLTGLWSPLITWLGRQMHLFKAIPALPNGSGDTTYNYLQLLCYLAIALVFGLVWSLLDRKRPNYNKLQYWFFVMLRYVLGFFMIVYGFAKIFKSQFPFPYSLRLLEPIGQQSPMGLAWTFMGYSTAFNLFTGFAEAIGGLLLMFRRTSTFGALFSMTVLSNIVAMNFCYDIPVKLLSVHLLLMAIIIASPEAKRLIDFFFLNKSVPAASYYSPVYGKKWLRISRVTLKVIIVFGLTGLMTYQGITEADEYGDYAPKSPMQGIYTVEQYVRGTDTIPPLLTDSSRWRYFIIDDKEYASVKTMSDKVIYYELKLDTAKRTMQLKNEEEAGNSTLSYIKADTNHIVLSGLLLKDSVYIKLKKKDKNDFRLVSRGFHWINEYPYNR